MNFTVPQFIEVESKIIGPLSLKQFLYLAGGAAIIFFTWYAFKFWFFVMVAIPTAVLSLCLAFLKINGRPFAQILMAFLGFVSKPRIYTWRKK